MGVKLRRAIAGSTLAAMGRLTLAVLFAALAFINCPTTAQPTESYQAGAADRTSFEQWFGNLTGDYRTGAAYWATHRSIPKEAHCAGDGDQLEGCLAAQKRLAAFDTRRRSEPNYRLGWNGAPQPAISIASAPALQAPTAEPLYHVQRDTYGCHNPRAALALTNPEEPRRHDPGWINYVINDGQCAPITPNSPWKMERREGDLAVMTYAGTTGLPGTYYLRNSDLSAPIASLSTVVAPLTSGLPNAGSVSQSPTPYNPASPPQPTTVIEGSASDPRKSNTYRSTSPSLGYVDAPPLGPSFPAPIAPEPVRPAVNLNQPSNWVVFVIAGAIVAFVTALVIAKSRAEKARIEAANARRRKATGIAFSEIGDKAHLLRVRREQLTQPDFYGTIDTGRWEKEKLSFVESRVIPLLNNVAMGDLTAELWPVIFAEMEAAAWRPIAPAMLERFSNPDSYSPDMDPIHYEMHCARQLQKAGWVTKATPRTGDQGADVSLNVAASPWSFSASSTPATLATPRSKRQSLLGCSTARTWLLWFQMPLSRSQPEI